MRRQSPSLGPCPPPCLKPWWGGNKNWIPLTGMQLLFRETRRSWGTPDSCSYMGNLDIPCDPWEPEKAPHVYDPSQSFMSWNRTGKTAKFIKCRVFSNQVRKELKVLGFCFRY